MHNGPFSIWQCESTADAFFDALPWCTHVESHRFRCRLRTNEQIRNCFAATINFALSKQNQTVSFSDRTNRQHAQTTTRCIYRCNSINSTRRRNRDRLFQRNRHFLQTLFRANFGEAFPGMTCEHQKETRNDPHWISAFSTYRANCLFVEAHDL